MHIANHPVLTGLTQDIPGFKRLIILVEEYAATLVAEEKADAARKIKKITMKK